MSTRSLFVLPNDNDDNMEASATELIFLLQSADEFALQFPFTHKDFWALQSHRIARAPKKIIYHLQRIYYCFKEDMPEQLYASLLDLLIALQGKREGISRRMFNGTKKALDKQHRLALEQFFSNAQIDEHDLPFNNYSVLSKGKVSHQQMVLVSESEANVVDHDPLALARDYIEYSQLDEARQVLEVALVEQPENEAIHKELLGLYESTQDSANFKQMYTYLQEQDSIMLKHWEQSSPILGGE